MNTSKKNSPLKLFVYLILFFIFLKIWTDVFNKKVFGIELTSTQAGIAIALLIFFSIGFHVLSRFLSNRKKEPKET